MAGVLEDFVSDSVEIAEEAVGDFAGLGALCEIVKSAETCWKGIAGKPTDCSTLGTFEACLDSALAVLPTGKIATIKQAKRAQEVMEQTNNMCKHTCRSGSCSTSSDTHQYNPPSGCTCKSMQFTTSNEGQGMTLAQCASNVAVSINNELVGKQGFEYMGCFVGEVGDDLGGCLSAYETQESDNGMFVRCINEDGNEFNVKKMSLAIVNDSSDAASSPVTLLYVSVGMALAFLLV